MIYGMPWEDHNYEDTNNLLVRSELFEPVNTTTTSDAQSSLPFDAMGIFYANMTTRMTPWQNILRLLRQSESTTSYIIITGPQKFDEISTWWNIPKISWSEGLTTVNIEQEESYKRITQYWQRCKILDQFNVLTQREDNWDGYNSKKPTALTLDHAKHLIEDLFDSIISAGYLWLTPFISSDENGNVTAEWYEEERQLHIQIGENEVEYIQVWGTNIDTEMHVDFLNHDDYQTLWEWLIDG